MGRVWEVGRRDEVGKEDLPPLCFRVTTCCLVVTRCHQSVKTNVSMSHFWLELTLVVWNPQLCPAKGSSDDLCVASITMLPSHSLPTTHPPFSLVQSACLIIN